MCAVWDDRINGLLTITNKPTSSRLAWPGRATFQYETPETVGHVRSASDLTNGRIHKPRKNKNNMLDIQYSLIGFREGGK